MHRPTFVNFQFSYWKSPNVFNTFISSHVLKLTPTLIPNMENIHLVMWYQSIILLYEIGQLWFPAWVESSYRMIFFSGLMPSVAKLPLYLIYILVHYELMVGLHLGRAQKCSTGIHHCMYDIHVIEPICCSLSIWHSLWNAMSNVDFNNVLCTSSIRFFSGA